MNRHLSPEQISEWMIGQKTPELEEHLGRCPQCAAEVDKIQAPLAMFRGAVREWSGHQVATPVKRSGVLWLRVAATAAVLVVLVVIGIDGANRRAAGIARQDDALLEQVQTQVSRSVPAPMEPLYDLMSEGSTK
jgi:anti-sigma factor RsiW